VNGKTRAGVGGEGVKVKKYTSVIQCCIGEIFSEPRIFLLTTIVNSLVLGQSASGLNFNDNSRCSPLADADPASGLKAFIFPSTNGLKLSLAR
jgi:hypothetical protein